MEKRKIGFKGEMYEETSLEDYKDKWVSITLRGNGSYMGKLSYLNKREAGLLPYMKPVSRDGQKMEYVIKYNGLPNSFERIDIVNFSESSEEEALNSCKMMNRKLYLESLREAKEMIDLENVISNHNQLRNIPIFSRTEKIRND